MKREEKVQLTRRKIMDNALEEFSARGYSAGSVNNIFDPKQGISKGIIYHYFSSKDELFLACVGECFERMKFFQENPLYQRIFMEAILMPPEHLRSQIMKCRQPMEEMNAEILGALLSRITLRVPLEKTEVIRLILRLINFIDLQYSLGENDVMTVEDLEKKNQQILDILMNGIVERRG